MSDNVQTPRDQFDEMNINDLRKYAKHLRIALNKTDTTEEMREKIREATRSKKSVQIALPQSEVGPGWSKIILNEDPTPGASNLPVYINANGYECTVPRGVEVIVPNKVVRVLNDAVVWKTKQEETTPGQPPTTRKYRVLSYPFQVLETVPGPDPRPSALEKQKAAVNGPKMKYKALFGRWPRRGELLQAVKDGFVSVGNNEAVSHFEQKFVEQRGQE